MRKNIITSILPKFADGVDEIMRFLHSPGLMQQNRLLPHNASGLLNAVNGITKTAKGVGAVAVYRVPTRFSNAAALFGHDSLLLTDGILKTFNYHNLHAAPPAELNAILAHEIGHLEQGLGAINAAHLPMTFAPAAGVGAAYLYREAKKLDKKSNAGVTPEAIHQVAEEERQSITESHGASKEEAEQKKGFVSMAELLAVGALGVAGCAMLTRRNVLALEFGADAFAVKATKNPEALIRGLKTVQAQIDADVSQAVRSSIEHMKDRTFFDNMKALVNALQGELYRAIYMAHPTASQRFDAIRRVSFTPSNIQM